MAHIQLRINYDEKQAAQAVLDDLGLTMSGAIKLFLKQVVREKGLPFSITSNGVSASEKLAPKKIEKKEVEISKTKKEWNGFSMKKIG